MSKSWFKATIEAKNIKHNHFEFNWDHIKWLSAQLFLNTDFIVTSVLLNMLQMLDDLRWDLAQIEKIAHVSMEIEIEKLRGNPLTGVNEICYSLSHWQFIELWSFSLQNPLELYSWMIQINSFLSINANFLMFWMTSK